MPLPAWAFAAHVAASPDDVYEWLADFREDDHSRPAYRRGAGVPERDGRVATRRVLRHEGNVVTVRDTWGRKEFTTRATLDPERREVRLEAPYGYRAAWRATPEGAGTRVTCEGRLAPKGLARLLVPLFARGMLAEMERDFRGHVADLEEALVPARAEAR